MNIAFIISVSKYDDKQNDLPACAKDAELMYDLLRATNKYDDHILYLEKNTHSTFVKEQVVDFINQVKGHQVDEVFFYYTGHGEFTGNEFYYLLSDYEPARRKQTALDNSELDNWLRLLNPSLTVKVVDACQAGVQYIKDPNAFRKFLAETPTSFNNCYFLYSSLKDQPSYQDRQLSYFTRSFCKAVLLFKGNQVRYKDIIDFISDDFDTIPDQTPFFITQATNTEVFCSVEPALKNILYRFPLIPSSEPLVNSGTTQFLQPKTSTLLEMIKSDAEKYCSEQQVLERIKKLQESVEIHEYSVDLVDLYAVKTEFLAELNSDIPKLSELGRWLDENKNEYFAVATKSPESYSEDVMVPRRYAGGLHGLYSTLRGLEDYETRTVTKVRYVIDGMKLTQEVPFKVIRIMAEPKFENLRWYSCYITFVFSKIEIRFFSLYNSFKDLNWHDRKADVSGNWRTSTCPLKDTNEALQSVKAILDGFSGFILKPLKDKFLSTAATSNNVQTAEQQTSTPVGTATQSD